MLDTLSGYHAHVYFDAQTLARAQKLVDAAQQHLPVIKGRVHEKLVGPHPMWSCQLAFEAGDFGAVIPWLMAHRQGLTVFVHPLTGNDWADHADYPCWLGESKELNLEMFQPHR